MTQVASSIQEQQAPLVTVDLKQLLRGKRYTWISHGNETYLLQLT